MKSRIINFFRNAFGPLIRKTKPVEPLTDALDILIEYWHTHNTGTELIEFLGVTDADYGQWLKGDGDLKMVYVPAGTAPYCVQLPNDTVLRTELSPSKEYPGITIWLHRPNDPAPEQIAFVEHNHEREGHELCVGAYTAYEDEPAYYKSYVPGPDDCSVETPRGQGIVRAHTPFGMLFAEAAGEPDHPGIHLCISKRSPDGELYEQQLALVETVPSADGTSGTSLRLLAWTDPENESYTHAYTLEVQNEK